MPSTPSSSAGPEPLYSELETFRTRWLCDLNLYPAMPSSPSAVTPNNASITTTEPTAPLVAKTRGKLPVMTDDDANDDELGDTDLIVPPLPIEEEGSSDEERWEAEQTGTGFGPEMFEGDVVKREKKEIVSALDHFEEAMKKEAHGNLGDSLNLYRKAYRMDPLVEKTYRAKHFPIKPSTGTPKTSPITKSSSNTQTPIIPETTTTKDPPSPLSITDLLASFEDRIWRTACLSFRFGFPSMHYSLPVYRLYTPIDIANTHAAPILSGSNRADRASKVPAAFPRYPLPAAEPRLARAQKVCMAILPMKPYNNSWRALYKHRPRLRYNGVYISRVNYYREGQVGANAKTIHSVHHVVTYFRYLRFYRDGSVISLQTTEEPVEVVPILDCENLNQTNEFPFLAYVLAGRWRMANTLKADRIRRFHPFTPDEMPWEHEGDVIVETEGIEPKYQYTMQMSLRTVGKKSVHNKLVWNGFWCLHTALGRWSDFPLANEKPFVFSRVKSYGFSEKGLIEDIHVRG